MRLILRRLEAAATPASGASRGKRATDGTFRRKEFSEASLRAAGRGDTEEKESPWVRDMRDLDINLI